MCPVLMKSAELEAQAARFSATFRSVLASTHFGETATVVANAPSFNTSRLVHCSIVSVSLSLKNTILAMVCAQGKIP
jgi:hypothetical protein